MNNDPVRTAGRRRAALLCLAAGVLLSGCASYEASMLPVLEAAGARDFDEALERLDKRRDEQSVLWLAERGLLLRYAGRLEESSASFLAARDRQDELYTRSVSNEAAALAVSDAVRPYRAAPFETAFLYVYPALNFLELGRLDAALVEARALSLHLEEQRDRDGPAADWPLGRALAALIFEAARETNDACVAWRSAAEAAGVAGSPADATAYDPNPAPSSPGSEPAPSEIHGERARPSSSSSLEVAIPPSSSSSLQAIIRAGLARCDPSAFSAIDPASALTGTGPAPGTPASDPGSRGGGHVVVWIESGWVPPMQDVHLRVPILKTESGWGEDRLEEWSAAVGDRALRVHAGSPCCGGAEIAYFLDVALPAYGPREAGRTEPWRVRGTAGLAGLAAEPDAFVFAAENLDVRARDDLERRYPSIAVRAAARALLKAGVTAAARKNTGDVGGTIANILGVATERADTRSWLLLPARIGLAVLEAPAGSVDVAVAAESAGSASGAAAGEFELSPGGWHFFTARLFD